MQGRREVAKVAVAVSVVVGGLGTAVVRGGPLNLFELVAALTLIAAATVLRRDPEQTRTGALLLAAAVLLPLPDADAIAGKWGGQVASITTGTVLRMALADPSLQMTVTAADPDRPSWLAVSHDGLTLCEDPRAVVAPGRIQREIRAESGNLLAVVDTADAGPADEAQVRTVLAAAAVVLEVLVPLSRQEQNCNPATGLSSARTTYSPTTRRLALEFASRSDLNQRFNADARSRARCRQATRGLCTARMNSRR